jgi:hypothetical protein
MTTTGREAPTRALANAIAPGETIRWTCAAPGGIVIRTSDWLAIPFSLLWTAFAIVWESLTFYGPAPVFFRLWGIPFVLVGLYVTVGRFFVDAALRARTSYVLTDRAAYIVRTGPFGTVRRYSDSALDSIDYRPRADGVGSIRFVQASTATLSRWYWYGGGWGLWSPSPLDGFYDVPDVRNVYAMILAARGGNAVQAPA